MKTQKKKPGKTTSGPGKPKTVNENAIRMAPRDPLLVQDFTLYEQMAHYNRERFENSFIEAPDRS